MIIGLLKEIKRGENRVALTPVGVAALVARGHQLLVEAGAGNGSLIPDEAYQDAGAKIVTTASDIFSRAEMILHVKEPQPSEYPLVRSGQMLFTFFHFAASEPLTRAMIDSDAVCIAYETVGDDRGGLPILLPMSEVAGRMAAQEAAKCLERGAGGRGILLGGVPGVMPATIVVLGGGTVGTEAARMACGLGAKVYLLETDAHRLRYLAAALPQNCTVLMSNPPQIRALLGQADAIIGAVLLRGAKAPHLITRDMLSLLQPGAVLIDVAIDQGGCFETSRPTTHEEPTFIVDGILHYCVANIPGAVPLTATPALTNATLPYIVALADQGWRTAARNDARIAAGINIAHGQVTCAAVAEAFGQAYTGIETILSRT